MKKNVLSSIKDKVVFVWKIPTFPILFLISTIFGLSNSFFVPFSSIFGIDEVGMSNISFGIFMTILAVGGILISSYIAKLSDTRVSRKKILIIASISGVLGYTLFAFLRSYFALAFTAFFVLGVSAAAVPQMWAYARDALQASNINKEDIPFVMNIFRMFFSLSWTIGPALASWLLYQLGFKFLFLFVAVGYFLAFLTIVFFLKDVKHERSSTWKAPRISDYLKKPHILGNLGAALLLTSATSIHMLNVPQFVTKVLHGTEMDVGVVFSVPPIFEVPLMIIVGILASKMDNARLIKIGYVIAFAYFFVFEFVSSPAQIYPIQILSAAHISITTGIAISYFQDFIPEAQGTATTLYMNTTQIGSTMGYLLFGFISQFISYGHLITIYTVFAGLGLLLLIMFGKEKINTTQGVPSKVQGL
jgi:MFS transporter, SET family, sugar efflux transporter